jgi:hypothetical protein
MSYSQELDPGDVDIFLNNFEPIMEKIGKTTLTEEFLSLTADVMTKFEQFWSNDISDEEFTELITLYKQFINYAPPKEFEKIFTDVEEWGSNGYKKYFTLFFGTVCIFMNLNSYFAEEDAEIIQFRIISIVGEHDLNIINSRIDDLNIF